MKIEEVELLTQMFAHLESVLEDRISPPVPGAEFLPLTQENAIWILNRRGLTGLMTQGGPVLVEILSDIGEGDSSPVAVEKIGVPVVEALHGPL